MEADKTYTIAERPQTEVYATGNGFIGIRQQVRGQTSIILLTPDEVEPVIGYLRACLPRLSNRDGRRRRLRRYL